MAEGKKVEELCHLLDLNADENCMQWMKTAVEHCGQIMNDPDTQDSNLWTAMRTAFGSASNREQIMSGVKANNGVHPDELSLEECSNLFKTIADDYFLKWPCFSYVEIITIETLIYGVVLAAVLAIFVFGYVLLIKKFKKNCEKANSSTSNYKQSMANGSVTTPKQNHDVQFQSTPRSDDEMSTVSCSKTIIVKINRERDGETVENGYNEYNFKDLDQEMPYQRATLEKIMDFVEDYSKNLRVVILIDDDKVYQELFNPCFENYQTKKQEPMFDLKYTRSISALSSSSSGMVRSRIPISNLRKSP